MLEKWAYIREFDVDDIQHENSECKYAIDELYDYAQRLEFERRILIKMVSKRNKGIERQLRNLWEAHLAAE